MDRGHKKSKKLKVPSCPSNGGEKEYYNINTLDEKLVSEYTGLNMQEVDELECVMFWVYLRDCIIYKYSESDEGRDYLEQCWILEQDRPDRSTLRDKFN